MPSPTRSARCAPPVCESPHTGALVSAVCLAVFVAACGRNDPLVSASPVAPTAPTFTAAGTVTLSGVVAEDGHPIENARVEAWWSSGRSATAYESITDAAGRYRIAGLPMPREGITFWAIARKDGYVQQCVETATTQADASLDLRLTSIANLSAARPRSGPGSRTVSGAVFEMTPTGRQPVEGASVAYSEGSLYYEDVAFTTSDPTGRYLLCGLPEGRLWGLHATKQGYSISNVSVQAGSDAIVDIEIRRQ